jgi:hypothetical protein
MMALWVIVSWWWRKKIIYDTRFLIKSCRGYRSIIYQKGFLILFFIIIHIKTFKCLRILCSILDWKLTSNLISSIFIVKLLPSFYRSLALNHWRRSLHPQ